MIQREGFDSDGREWSVETTRYGDTYLSVNSMFLEFATVGEFDAFVQELRTHLYRLTRGEHTSELG